MPIWCRSLFMSTVSSSSLLESSASSRSLSPPRKNRTPPAITFSFSERLASFIISTAFASVHICRFQSSRVIFTAHIAFWEERSDVTRLKRAAWMLRLSLWLVVFALDERRSERIFWESNARKDLLPVVMRSGKRVLKRVVESIRSLFRSSTRLPTTFSLSSGSSVA